MLVDLECVGAGRGLGQDLLVQALGLEGVPWVLVLVLVEVVVAVVVEVVVVEVAVVVVVHLFDSFLEAWLGRMRIDHTMPQTPTIDNKTIGDVAPILLFQLNTI